MQKIAQTTNIAEGKSLIVKLSNGTEIALFKIEGQIYALENYCPHMGGPLGQGKIEKDRVTCPWHEWQFEIKTGKCDNMPGDDAKKISIRVEGTDIYLIEDEDNY